MKKGVRSADAFFVSIDENNKTTDLSVAHILLIIFQSLIVIENTI